MLIQNKWVVRETRGNVYFTGMNSNNYPVLESLSSRVRVYKNEKAAKMAINRIGTVEYCEFAVEYIESEEVPDVPQDKPSEPPIIKYDEGWSIVDQFGKKILYLRKEAACRYIYAVLDENGDLRGFGFDEKAAWIWYSNYRRDFGVKRIEERLGKQQNGERGNAEK